MTDSPPHYAGRRVFCKADGSASSLSRKISLAALPDSKQGFPVRVWSKHSSATNVGVKATLIAAERLEKETTPAPKVKLELAARAPAAEQAECGTVHRHQAQADPLGGLK